MFPKIHFISIGGSVMHNLAIELQRKGFEVTGSDDEIYEPSASRLAAHSLLPEEIGWFPDRITADLDAVILGMHARMDNPELLKAQELGLRIYSYPEYIFEQSRDKQRVVIAGSHGKTTITAMILHVLNFCNRRFNYLVGAGIQGFDTMVRLDDEAPMIVVEGDEYFTSPLDPTPKFLHYQPHLALVSGIAWDHYNVFPTFESYVKQFELLVDSLPKSGGIVFDETDNMLDVICQKDRVDVTKMPYEAHPYKIVSSETFLITKNQGNVPVLVFGEHNMKNINGARLVCERLGVSEEEFYTAIQTFKGATNRLEIVAKNNHTILFKDFAHSPSKVEATTRAVKQQFPGRKLVACAELHTFSSLNKDFLGQYQGKFDKADIAIVFYNPQTVEHKRLPSISEEDIRNAFLRSDLKVFTDAGELAGFLEGLSWYNSNLLLMSSGNFGGLNLEKLSAHILSDN